MGWQMERRRARDVDTPRTVLERKQKAWMHLVGSRIAHRTWHPLQRWSGRHDTILNCIFVRVLISNSLKNNIESAPKHSITQSVRRKIIYCIWLGLSIFLVYGCKTTRQSYTSLSSFSEFVCDLVAPFSAVICTYFSFCPQFALHRHVCPKHWDYRQTAAVHPFTGKFPFQLILLS